MWQSLSSTSIYINIPNCNNYLFQWYVKVSWFGSHLTIAHVLFKTENEKDYSSYFDFHTEAAGTYWHAIHGVFPCALAEKKKSAITSWLPGNALSFFLNVRLARQNENQQILTNKCKRTITTIGVARIFERGVTPRQSEGSRLFGHFQAQTAWHFRHLF